MLKFTGRSDIKGFVRSYFERSTGLKDRVVIDVPAGTGEMSTVLRELGADVRAYDLFPRFFAAEGLECTRADLIEPLPVPDQEADMVLCQEGLEHMPNQLAVLREFNRILKNGGTLIITVPNISHLRGKLSNLLMESDLYKRMPPNELDAVWFSDEGRMYFGHIFLIGVQRLRVLARIAGFRIVKIHPVKVSYSSLLMGFLYPLVLFANALAYFKSVRRADGVSRAEKERTYKEIVKLNIHPTVLFGKHLFIELRKEQDAAQVNITPRPQVH